MANIDTLNPFRYLLVDEMIDSRQGSPWSIDGHREYTRKFKVILRSPNPVKVPPDLLAALDAKKWGADAICHAPGLPLPGAFYLTGEEFDLAAVVVRYDAEREHPDDSYTWIVTVHYSTRVPEGGPTLLEGFGSDLGGAQNDPSLKPWHLEWDSNEYMITPASDLDGQPFINSAGQPFSPPPQLAVVRPTLKIVRNELTFDRSTVTKYSYSTNSDTFLGCEPGTVMCHRPRAVLSYLGSIRYWRVTWVFEFGETKPAEATPETYLTPGNTDPAWDQLTRLDYMFILDQGLCRRQYFPLFPNVNQPVPIYRNGHQIAQPDLLDGAGQPVVPTETGYRAPVFKRFRIRRTLPFAPIFTSGLGSIYP